jgi:hypothetical protein
MKKLAWIPTVVFALNAAVSFGLSIYEIYWSHDNGSAALHLIFTFTGIIAGAGFYAIATT